MPQTKQAKRKKAIELYGQAMAVHHDAIPRCPATKVDMHRKAIKNLEKLITDTAAKR